MLPMGGTNANLSVDDALKAAFGAEASSRPRAAKVAVDPAAERLVCAASVPVGSESPAEVFEAVAKLLEDSVPCLALICLHGLTPQAGEADCAMVAWTPSDSPVKLRMLCASSRRTLRDEFPSLKFKEYSATERDEVTLERFVESTRARTERDRKDAMTQDELDQDEVRQQVAKEQAAAPKMLAGLAALQAKVLPSFEEAMARFLAEQTGLAVMASLEGSSGEELGGKVLEAVSSPVDLRGRLPAEQPCYVALRCEGKVLLITWLPDGAGVKARMKTSTFKASVVDRIRELANDSAVTLAEANSEEDLDGSLAASKPAPEADKAEAAVPATDGKKPPAGAVALPGMGGGPPGGFKLPGMGAGGLKPHPKEGGYNQAKPAEAALFADKEKVVEKPVFAPRPSPPPQPAAAQPAAAPPAAEVTASTPAAAAPAADDGLTLSLEELQDPKIWKEKDIVATERERYLPDAVFASLFGMDKNAFAKLPKWKRDNKKKEHGLF